MEGFSSGVCGPWFATADLLTRVTIGFWRNVKAAIEFPERCWKGVLGKQQLKQHHAAESDAADKATP